MLNFDKFPNGNYPIYDNLLGEKNQNTWKKMEFDLTQVRTGELKANLLLVNQTFDAKHLMELHKYIFQDCYPWAGELRDNGGQTIPSWSKRKYVGNDEYLSIYTPDGFIFERLPEISQIMKDHNYGKGCNKEQLGGLLGELSDRINEIHLFREGNSRTKRVFLQQVAQSCGFDLNFSKISVEKLTNAEFIANSSYCNGHSCDLGLRGRIQMLKETYLPLLEEKNIIKNKANSGLSASERKDNVQCEIKASEVVRAKIKSEDTKKRFDELLKGENLLGDKMQNQNQLLMIAGLYSNYDKKTMTEVFCESKLSAEVPPVNIQQKVNYITQQLAKNNNKTTQSQNKNTQKKNCEQNEKTR